MKKVFFLGIAAAAMLASCSNDETIDISQAGAIGFSNAFVNNGTRSTVDPSLTAATLGSFNVYGYSNTNLIFTGDVVSSNDKGVTWTYDDLRYWMEGCDYVFAGIAPAGKATVSGVERLGSSVTDYKVGFKAEFTNDGTTDLLYAGPAAVAYSATPSKVGMTFDHMLSKVKFSFTNDMSDAYTIKVSNIQITNTKQTGTLTIGTGEPAWSAQSGSATLSFGNATEDAAQSDEAVAIAFGKTAESYYERLLIPTDNSAEYIVKFTVELFSANDVEVGQYEHTVTVKNVALQIGYCYDFAATLDAENIDPDTDLKPIEFEVKPINGWTDQTPAPELPVDPVTPGA